MTIPGAEKLNQGRWMGPREAANAAEPKGNAKTLRQKDRIRTTLRKVRARPHTKGATGSRRAVKGNLSGKDGGKKTECLFVSFSLLR